MGRHTWGKFQGLVTGGIDCVPEDLLGCSECCRAGCGYGEDEFLLPGPKGQGHILCLPAARGRHAEESDGRERAGYRLLGLRTVATVLWPKAFLVMSEWQQGGYDGISHGATGDQIKRKEGFVSAR